MAALVKPPPDAGQIEGLSGLFALSTAEHYPAEIRTALTPLVT
jgi:hypothetical protein